MDFQNRAVDVICQHTKEGKLIPIKLRLQDDEEEFQTYVVKAYKNLSHIGSYIMPNEITATSTIFRSIVKYSVWKGKDSASLLQQWWLDLAYGIRQKTAGRMILADFDGKKECSML